MAEIKLTKGCVALIDEEDLSLISEFKWCCVSHGGHFYAATRNWKISKNKLIYMHRIILDAPTGMDVDHINGNGLDNRRANLRLCTRSENCRNRRKSTSSPNQYKGVHFSKETGKWSAGICLGSFNTEKEAALAYDEAARKIFGEFARVNFKK